MGSGQGGALINQANRGSSSRGYSKDCFKRRLHGLMANTAPSLYIESFSPGRLSRTSGCVINWQGHASVVHLLRYTPVVVVWLSGGLVKQWVGYQ